MLGIAMSSLMNKTKGSSNLPKPLGIGPFLYELDRPLNAKNSNTQIIKVIKTVFVIEKSSNEE